MTTFSIIQIVISVVLIGLIILQERSSGLSGVFGGGGGGYYQTRRGLEKIVFWATIFFAIAFAAIALANLVL
ncbi:MAG: preprotein translocase subunit SecG [Patescibacteria group bacterium]